MNTITLLNNVIIFILVTSCGLSETLEKKLIGKWTMEKVYEYGKDVTAKHNPSHNRYFRFNEDGTFMSDGDPFGKNTGRWRVDNEKSILYIDSDTEDDDSEWKVTFKDDETIWTGIGHPRKENTTLVHKRSSE